MSQNSDTNEIDLYLLWQAFWKGRFVFLVTASVIFLAGFLIAFLPQAGLKKAVFQSSPLLTDSDELPSPMEFSHESIPARIEYSRVSDSSITISLSIQSRNYPLAEAFRASLLEKASSMACASLVTQEAKKSLQVLNRSIRTVRENLAFLGVLESVLSGKSVNQPLMRPYSDYERQTMSAVYLLPPVSRQNAVKELAAGDRALLATLTAESDLTTLHLSNDSLTRTKANSRYKERMEYLQASVSWSERITSPLDRKITVRIIGLLFLGALAAGLTAVYLYSRFRRNRMSKA